MKDSALGLSLKDAIIKDPIAGQTMSLR